GGPPLVALGVDPEDLTDGLRQVDVLDLGRLDLAEAGRVGHTRPAVRLGPALDLEPLAPADLVVVLVLLGRLQGGGVGVEPELRHRVRLGRSLGQVLTGPHRSGGRGGGGDQRGAQYGGGGYGTTKRENKTLDSGVQGKLLGTSCSATHRVSHASVERQSGTYAVVSGG